MADKILDKGSNTRDDSIMPTAAGSGQRPSASGTQEPASYKPDTTPGSSIQIECWHHAVRILEELRNEYDGKDDCGFGNALVGKIERISNEGNSQYMGVLKGNLAELAAIYVLRYKHTSIKFENDGATYELKESMLLDPQPRSAGLLDVCMSTKKEKKLWKSLPWFPIVKANLKSKAKIVDILAKYQKESSDGEGSHSADVQYVLVQVKFGDEKPFESYTLWKERITEPLRDRNIAHNTRFWWFTFAEKGPSFLLDDKRECKDVRVLDRPIINNYKIADMYVFFVIVLVERL